MNCLKQLPRYCALLLIGTLVSCTTQVIHLPPGYIPVTQPAARFDIDGFSLVPPPGAGWYGGRTGPYITFFKGFGPTHTFVADIAVIKLTKVFNTPQEFMQYVKESKSKDTDPQRFTIIVNDYGLDSKVAPYCVQYHSQTQDHHSPVAPGEILVLDAYGITCIHPDDSHHAVQIEYSERSKSGDLTATEFNEGMAFISSLKFVPLKKLIIKKTSYS